MRYFEIFSRFSRFAAASAVHILLQFSTHTLGEGKHMCVFVCGPLPRTCMYVCINFSYYSKV